MLAVPIAGLTTIIDISTCCSWIYNTQFTGLLRIGIKDSRESIMSRMQMMSHSKRKCNLFKCMHMNTNANANGNSQGNASVQGENAKFYMPLQTSLYRWHPHSNYTMNVCFFFTSLEIANVRPGVDLWKGYSSPCDLPSDTCSSTLIS